MTISHLCVGCGQELARERAAREPVYGLWLVTCPRCGRHATRRPEAWRGLIRWILRMDAVVTTLGLQLAAMAAAFAGGLTAVAGTWAVLTGPPGNYPTTPQAAATYGIVMVGGAILCGAWLTAGLFHWRRWVAWLTFGVLLWIGAMGIVVGVAIDGAQRAGDGRLMAVLDSPEARHRLWVDAGLILGLTAFHLAAATAGLPVGWAIIWITGRLRLVRWRVFRRRARRARNVMS